MDDKIVKGIIIGIIIVAIVAIVVLILIVNSQQTITGFHNPVVDATYAQFLYNIHTLTPIHSISVNFSMKPVPNVTPADGIQIILGSNNVRFTGGVGQCRIQGTCGPPIMFSGIMVGIEIYAVPYLFICSSKGQCFTTPIFYNVGQPLSGTLTVYVYPNNIQAILQYPGGTEVILTAPLSIKTNIAEVSVTTGGSYAIWNLNSITIKTAII